MYCILSWTIEFTSVRMRIFNARCLLCRVGAKRNDPWHASFNLRYNSTLDPSNHLTATRTSIYFLGSRFLETQDLCVALLRQFWIIHVLSLNKNVTQVNSQQDYALFVLRLYSQWFFEIQLIDLLKLVSL